MGPSAREFTNSLKSLAGTEVAPGWWTWAVVQDVMEVSRSVAEIFSFPSWASIRKFWRWHKSGGSCARLPRSCGVLRAVSPGVGYGFTPRGSGGWLGFLSPPGAERGAAPRRAPDAGGSLGLAAGRVHGREGRGVGKNRGWAAGCLFSLRRPFQTFLAFHALEVGRTEKTRCCGPLRACNGGAMAGSGPFRGPLEGVPGRSSGQREPSGGVPLR